MAQKSISTSFQVLAASKSRSKYTTLNVEWTFFKYCVLWPASGCSPRPLLVEIDFLTIKQIFPSLTKKINKKIENYRPIANLCSASKIFERPILKQIHYLENKNLLDLTGKQQHGFKKIKRGKIVFKSSSSIILSLCLGLGGHICKKDRKDQYLHKVS